MGKKNATQIEAEKQELAKKETAQFGKVLGTQPSSEDERRQQALAMLRKKAQEKRDGKRVAVDECVADKQAPSKRARAPRIATGGALVLEKQTKEGAPKPPSTTKLKMPRTRTAPPPLEQEAEAETVEEEQSPESSEAEPDPNSKSFNDHRDRKKKPTEKELLEQLRKGVSWPPTRFADIRMMKEIDIDNDMKNMLELMGIGSFYSMAHLTHKEVSCQFLATLDATFHSKEHAIHGWGFIKFRIDGKAYSMTFKEIGEVFGFTDLKEPSLPKPKKLIEGKTLSHHTFKLLSGRGRLPSRDKNASIRHPAVRYLHRLIVHTLFPRKEVSNINSDHLRLIHQAVQHYASPPQLPAVPSDFYSNFGMVGFFVKRLMYYKSYAWTSRDPEAQIGIGGLITPLLQHKGISLSDDGTGPSFLDLNYLRSAQYFSSRFDGRCVYTYLSSDKTVEITLPNYVLTTLTTPGAIGFDIDESHLLGPHGPLEPILLPGGEKAAPTHKVATYDKDYTSSTTAHLFGQPRYSFKQFTGALPHGPLRQAHDQISNLQRWTKAQDRTIYKLTNKCKELRQTVKRQAEASAQFMKKVVEVLTNGAVAGCKTEDFDLDAFLAPPPRPLYDPSAPCTRKQSLRHLRNPYIGRSDSGNMSPSLDTTEDEADSEGEASATSHAP